MASSSGWFRKILGNGGLFKQPSDVGRRGVVGVLGRTLVIVTAIVATTVLLVTIVLAAVCTSPMIAWYAIRSGKRTTEVTPKKKQYVSMNIDEILGVKK